MFKKSRMCAAEQSRFEIWCHQPNLVCEATIVFLSATTLGIVLFLRAISLYLFITYSNHNYEITLSFSRFSSLFQKAWSTVYLGPGTFKYVPSFVINHHNKHLVYIFCNLLYYLSCPEYYFHEHYLLLKPLSILSNKNKTKSPQILILNTKT